MAKILWDYASISGIWQHVFHHTFTHLILASIDASGLCQLCHDACLLIIFYFHDYFHTFKNWWKRKEGRGRETWIGCLLHTPQLGIERTWNIGMCPSWNLNPRPVCAQDNAPTEPHQPGLLHFFLEFYYNKELLPNYLFIPLLTYINMSSRNIFFP